jgi:transcriptional regulator with XRE-family HTH domain
MKNYFVLGSKLREKRLKLQQTTTSVANSICVNRTYISKLENGHERPSVNTLYSMLLHYSVSEEEAVELLGLAGYSERGVGQVIQKREEVNDKNIMDNTIEKNAPNFNIDPNRTPVLYADNVSLKSNANGVVFDFAQQVGPTNQYNIVSRIGMSKDHAKQVAEHLEALLRTDGMRSTKKDS